MESFRSVTCALRDRYLPYHDGRLAWKQERIGNNLILKKSIGFAFTYLLMFLGFNLQLPPWLCQPYERELPQQHIYKLQVRY